MSAELVPVVDANDLMVSVHDGFTDAKAPMPRTNTRLEKNILMEVYGRGCARICEGIKNPCVS